jgi:hypothetical protein
MQNNLLVAGMACVIAALIGGGLKAFTIEIPLLGSMRRQIALGLFGAILMALSFAVWWQSEFPGPPAPLSQTTKQAPDQTPSAPTPSQHPRDQEISLAKSSFLLPDDGIRMNNAKVGPFCCTGNVVIVRSPDGDPIGYIYFYSWKGQAYNVEGGSIVPDISVLVSGPATLGNSGTDQLTSHIEFKAAHLEPQSNWTQAGLLQYRATVLDFKLERGPLWKPYFDMGSLKIRVDVRPATNS